MGERGRLLNMLRKVSLVCALALVAACSPAKSESAPITPVALAKAPHHAASGLPVIPLSITHNGKKHNFRVEVAASDADQEKGLMFRTAMGADEGMIFPMNPPLLAAFWMKNTVMSLDIIYIGADHRVLNIAANAVPYSETALYSEGRVSAVLELNAGRAAQLGIGKGDLVKW
ncbi:MAG: DUF192 domain-containing protein [Novosphingobium sp.]